MIELDSFEHGTNREIFFEISSVDDMTGVETPFDLAGARLEMDWYYNIDIDTPESKLHCDAVITDEAAGKGKFPIIPTLTNNLTKRDYDWVVRLYDASGTLTGSERGKVILW